MRLELSRKTDLALRAIRHLGREGRRVTRRELADAVGTSPDFMAKVLGPLVEAGWVHSGPGRGGGYELAAAVDGASILDLIDRTEGIPSETVCVLRGGPCDLKGPCALHDPWTKARAALLNELDQTPVWAGRPA